ncbi:MAG: heavy metal-binding domain-containing protein [Lutibacter sp.]|nr:heavy metal-binding domain-containing protein [Lutibacter sp.]
MKKSLFVFVAIFSFAVLFSACKETKKEEVKEEVKIESHEVHDHEEGEMPSSVYQCPMDCEKGKTYEVAGSCPVCKMDLVAISNETAHVEGCKCIASGACKCEGGKCICKTEIASKECTKCEPGKCTCKAEVVSNVKTTAKCEPGKCACKA